MSVSGYKKASRSRGRGKLPRRSRVASCASREAPSSLVSEYHWSAGKNRERRRMSEYTVVKVADVPDQGPNLGTEGGLEIRFLRNDLNCENCGVSFARYTPGYQADGHTHNRQEEIYMLVSG